METAKTASLTRLAGLRRRQNPASDWPLKHIVCPKPLHTFWRHASVITLDPRRRFYGLILWQPCIGRFNSLVSDARSWLLALFSRYGALTDLPLNFEDGDVWSSAKRLILCVDLKEIVMSTGTVKFFNSTRGYGFIQPDEGSSDVFVHVSAVERAGLRSLFEGQKVSFEVVKDARSGKSSAENLQAL